jgi:hypothetical protein
MLTRDERDKKEGPDEAIDLFKRYIICAPRQVEAGKPVAEGCHKLGISEQTPIAGSTR